MATVLMTWELGGGMGHLVRLGPLAAGVRAAGHRVVVALRDLSRARGVFEGMGVELVQAPVQTRGAREPVASPMTLAHLLHNVGFGSEGELWGMGEGWRNLYRMVGPKVVVFDHSPTALLAARGLSGVRRVVVGSGFFCPPDESPLRNLHPRMKGEAGRLAEDERRVLGVMNRVLGEWGLGAVGRVTQMYGEVDRTILTTFAELDHYGERAGVKYWGAWTGVGGGKRVEFPRGPGMKMFAYLKATKEIEAILKVLEGSALPVVAVVEGLTREAAGRFQSGRMRVGTEAVDIREAGAWCDFAVLNGNHGTTAAMLRMGRPVVELPIFLEQAMLARAVVRMGAGVEGSVNQVGKVASAMVRVAETVGYHEAARGFAEKYAGFDEGEAVRGVVGEIVGGVSGISCS